MAAARCLGVDPAVFYPPQGGDLAPALGICAPCPVRAECLAYALDHAEPGVWGATSERERNAMRRGRLPGRRCQWEQCRAVFTPAPGHHGQRYCTPAHQVASLRKRKRAVDSLRERKRPATQRRAG